jgi:predicted nucleic acid-binding protein
MSPKPIRRSVSRLPLSSIRNVRKVWTLADTLAAHEAWCRHVAAKRAAKIPKRPIADLLIGAFASRFDGILTRNDGDFRATFPNLKIVTP